MLIRRLALEDAVALQSLRGLVDLNGALGRPAERQLALTIEHIRGQLIASIETIGGFIERSLVGSASLSRMPECIFDAESTEWFGLSAIIVHPNFRGRGVGRALLNECLSRAAQHKAKGMLLELYVPNPAAKALYESLGFEAWNVFEGDFHYNNQRYDKVSMRKRLSGA